MISDMTFYSGGYSHRNRIFPIGTIPESHKVKVFEKVTCTEDLAQVVQLPWFAGWDTCNLVYVHESQEYYWINQMGTVTKDQKQIRFELVLNTVTSYVKSGDSIRGIWDRLPTNIDVNIKDPAVGGALGITRTVNLPVSPYPWVELVLKKRIGYPDERITRYGMFCKRPNQAGVLETNTLGCYIQGNNYYNYPSMFTIVNNFAEIFDTVESTDIIMSINVSARCPYWCKVGPDPNITTNGPYLYKSSNYPFITPRTFKQYQTVGTSKFYYCMYEIDGTNHDDLRMQTDTLTITLTDEELKSGDVSLLNGSGAIISTIPTEYFENNTLDISVASSSDFLGIYTDVTMKGHSVRLTASRLPWLGDAFLDYQARTMAYDRSSMELAIANAQKQKEIDIMMGATNSVMTGVLSGAMGASLGPAGVLAGVGMGLVQTYMAGVGANLQQQLSERTARSEQELTEENQKVQLSNFYNVSEGIKSLVDEVYGKYRLSIAMPVGVDPAYYTNYRDEYGFKTHGVKTITVSAGYHKGRILDTPVNGLKGDLLNNEFIEGLKLIEIGGV